MAGLNITSPDYSPLDSAIERFEEMRNFAETIRLPETVEEMIDDVMYSVEMDYLAYPDTKAIFLVNKRTVLRLRQLIFDVQVYWVLHADAKHKLQYGKWILLPLGTHMLRYDQGHKYTHSFCPLLLQWTKQHESTKSVRMANDVREHTPSAIPSTLSCSNTGPNPSASPKCDPGVCNQTS